MEVVEDIKYLDEAILLDGWLRPRMKARLDRIIAEVVGKFKGGTLSQESLTQLRADWLATSRLMSEIEMLIDQGGKF